MVKHVSIHKDNKHMASKSQIQPSLLSQPRNSLRKNLLKTSWGYHAYMRLRWGTGKRQPPSDGRTNRTLRSQAEVAECVEEAKRLSLPPCEDAPKTWDTLAAVREVLLSTTPDATILDAGAEVYSRFLPWLYLYGYRKLYGINLIFGEPVQQGTIRYEQGDITRTRFPADHFDAIACLSVVEHGVDLNAFFAEMSRILKPGGVLVTSTDYFETPTDTSGLTAYGVPIHVFDREEIVAAVKLAQNHGLHLTGELDLSCQEKVVRWHPHKHEYTFISMAMKKKGGNPA